MSETIELLKAARELCARGPCVGAFERDEYGDCVAGRAVIDGHCYCPIGALLALASPSELRHASDLLCAEAQRLGYKSAIELNDERPDLVLPMFDAAISRLTEAA